MVETFHADNTPTETRRSWWHSTPVRIALGLLALLFAVWLILFITKGRFLKSPFESLVTSVADREVRVGGDFQLYFAPLDLKFLAEDMQVSNPAWASKPHLFTAQKIETRVAPLSLLFGTTHLRWLELVGASFDLEWDAQHKANSWTFRARAEPLELPTIARASLQDTRLRYLDPQMQLLADLHFNPVAARDTRIEEAVRFTGQGKLRATPFTLLGALLRPNQTVARGTNQLQLRANTATDQIDISGTLPSLVDIEGAPLAVAASGRNAAELLNIIGVIIPDTRSYRVRAELRKQGGNYHFDRLQGSFGASDIAGRFTLKTGGERRHISADLTSQVLDVVDAAPFIGYNPDMVAKRGFEAAAAQTGAAASRLLPDANLRAEGVRLFDADVRYRVKTLRSDSVPVTDIDATVKLDDGLLSLSPLGFTMARGKVTSDIQIDWRRQPARTRYDIRLGDTPMGRLLAGYGVLESGTSGTVRGRIDLTGDGDTLHNSLATSRGRIAFVIPEGTFWTRNIQLSELDFGTFVQKMFQGKLKEPIRINCGLVAFTVRNGAASADPILIDTSRNVILGRGGFSFANEQMDLGFRADAKNFSLFSAQSPVKVGGTFADPSLNVVSPELLARSGAALGLAIAAFPPAAVLAFVDVGDAKSTACGPVLAGASAAAQRTTGGKPRDDLGTPPQPRNLKGK